MQEFDMGEIAKPAAETSQDYVDSLKDEVAEGERMSKLRAALGAIGGVTAIVGAATFAGTGSLAGISEAAAGAAALYYFWRRSREGNAQLQEARNELNSLEAGHE